MIRAPYHESRQEGYSTAEVEVDRFKLNHPSCSGCGATMGQDVKLLLDTDVCPFCEEGKVSLIAPVCDKCGQRIDPGIVVWG